MDKLFANVCGLAMLPNRKRELKNKFELNRRFSAKTKTAILPNHC